MRSDGGGTEVVGLKPSRCGADPLGPFWVVSVSYSVAGCLTLGEVSLPSMCKEVKSEKVIQ